ncbi:MAG: hypothetical protein ACRD3W_04295, partial [Terriglobales bacterium]
MAPPNKPQPGSVPDVTTVVDNHNTGSEAVQTEVQQQYVRTAGTPADRTGPVTKLEHITITPLQDATISKVDPFESSRNANAAAVELKQLINSKLPDTAVVNDNGTEKTVAQVRKELQDTIRQQMNDAINRSDSLKQTGGDDSVEALLSKFTKDPNKDGARQQLAKDLGLDPRNVTLDQIQQLQNSASASPDQRQKAQQLYELEREFQDLNELRYA